MIPPTPQKIFNLTAIAVTAIALTSLPSISQTTATPVPADRGKLLFEKRCTGCHSLDRDEEGPQLRTVYGRKAGTIPTFKYSEALKSSHITWDETSLDKWLTNPDALVPDNDMTFRVPNPDERADIIRFLRVSSGQ